MHVARSFLKPKTAHCLETVQKDALEPFLETAPQDPEALKLHEWQMQKSRGDSKLSILVKPSRMS